MITSMESIFEQTNKHLPWLPKSIIFATLHGSHAYGLNTPESDEDVRGICIPPKEYLFGFINNFDQADLKDPDTNIFGIQKFFKLASLCNPNCVEILFTEPEDHIIMTPIGKKLIENRHLFLSKLAKHSFLGYAKSQLHRIENHKKWITSEFSKRPNPPMREEFNLPSVPEISNEKYNEVNSLIQNKMEEWILDYNEFNSPQKIFLKEIFERALTEIYVSHDKMWEAAGRMIGLNESFINIIVKEKLYRSKLRDWNSYQEWLVSRNKKRAELEAKCGYDSKHASHLIRLLIQAKDLFKNNDLKIKDSQYTSLLKEIKAGNYPYDDIIVMSKDLEKEVIDCFNTSKLPSKPDHVKLDKLCMELINEFYV